MQSAVYFEHTNVEHIKSVNYEVPRWLGCCLLRWQWKVHRVLEHSSYIYAHILYCGFNSLHHKVFPLCCDLSWSGISRDDLRGKGTSFISSLPLCVHVSVRPRLLFPSASKWMPPTLPFKHALTLKCKTLSESGRSTDYMWSRGNLLTDKPEHFNHL